MRDLGATATDEAGAAIERCFELVTDVEQYPRWYPAGVKRAEPLERATDGQLTKVIATLVLAHGRIQRDFTLHMEVTREPPRLVELRRLPKHPGDQEQVVISWRLSSQGPQRTRVEVELAAKLDLPRFLPLGGVADSIANGFLSAALDALRAG